METLAWAIYALFLVGPYVLVAAAVCGAVFVGVRVAFKVNSTAGVSAVVLVTVASGWVFYTYAWEGATAFKKACSTGTGLSVLRTASANSYSLPWPTASRGGYNLFDAANNAIQDVAFGRVPFVEIQDWPAHEAIHGAPGELARFRSPSLRGGYFRVTIDELPSPRCRWLMPGDVDGHDYGSYLSSGLTFELNKRLQQKVFEGKKCVAVDYVREPSAKYAIEVKDEQVGRSLFRYEVRVLDRSDDSKLLSQAVAYHHQSKSVWEAMGFWIANSRGHDQCPLNLLIGSRVLEQTLNLPR